MPNTNEKRVYAAGKFGLELDGASAGWVQNASGGNAWSPVVQEKVGPGDILKKHIAGVMYEEITVETGPGMGTAFYKWLKDTYENKYVQKDGAIVTADFNYKEMSRREFYKASISEIGFPALDATSKDAAKLTVKFSPGYTRVKAPSRQSVSSKYAIDPKLQKKWIPANFRLTIPGLDCTHVNRIAELVLKQRVIENPVGEVKESQREHADLEISNLMVTLSESSAETWYAWHEDFVIKGNHGDDKEKNGTLEYLTPNYQEVLFKLTFSQMGIFNMEEEKTVAGSQSIHCVKAQLYVGKMDFDFNAAWA